MKKAKILSAFLSLTLVTSFAAVPTTVSAVDIVTTTTAPTVVQTTTTTDPAYIRTTTTQPPTTVLTTTVPHTTTAGPDRTVNTTITTSAPIIYNEKKVKFNIVAMDIDSGEYVSGMNVYIGHDRGWEKETLDSFRLDCEQHESETLTAKFPKGIGASEKFYVAVDHAPLGYELVQSSSDQVNPAFNEFTINDDSPETIDCVFYVRKLAQNASPETGLSSVDDKFFFRVYINSNTTGEPVENIDMKLVKIMKDSGEEVVLETWNTTGDPLHYTNIYDYDENASEYLITSEKLPDFYRQGNTLDHVMLHYDFKLGEGHMYQANLTLNKYKKEMPEFPLKTDVDYKIMIQDRDTGKLFNDLDVTINKVDDDNNIISELYHSESGISEYTFVIPCEFEDIYSYETIQVTLKKLPDEYYSDNGTISRTFKFYGYAYDYYYSMDKLDEPILDYINPESYHPHTTTVQRYHTGTTTAPHYNKTTTTTAAVPTVKTTATSKNVANNIKGDANCDGDLSMADAVIIMQSLANPAKYGIEGTNENHITEQGKKNADIAGDNDGITNADALAIQKKLLGLDKTQSKLDIAGKTFIYEKDGIGGDFTISFDEKGHYSYYEGSLSSYIGSGLWSVSDDTVVLTDPLTGNTIRLKIQDDSLVYIEEDSSNFYYIKVKDGEKFYLAEEPDYAAINNLPEIVTIKSDFNPIMSDWSGIGILLEFDSKDYPITLSTNEGHFTTWDKETGVGVVSNVGKTYDIGNKGYVFWTPDDINFDADYRNEIVIIGEKDGKSVKLGNIVVTTSNSHTLTAVLK